MLVEGRELYDTVDRRWCTGLHRFAVTVLHLLLAKSRGVTYIAVATTKFEGTTRRICVDFTCIVSQYQNWPVTMNPRELLLTSDPRVYPYPAKPALRLFEKGWTILRYIYTKNQSSEWSVYIYISIIISLSRIHILYIFSYCCIYICICTYIINLHISHDCALAPPGHRKTHGPTKPRRKGSSLSSIASIAALKDPRRSKALWQFYFFLVCPHEKCKKVDKAAPEKNGSEKKNSQ